jgi:beta-N-acetylhexosaminidase
MKEKSWIRYLLLFEGIALILVVALVAFQQVKGTEKDNIQQENPNIDVSDQENDKPPVNEVKDPTDSTTKVEFSAKVNDKIKTMTLEEKIAQLFLITPEMLTGADVVTVAGPGTKTAFDQYPVGGLIYIQSNFMGKQQTAKMLSGTQTYSTQRSGLPIFLAIAEEGGTTGSPVAITNTYKVQPFASEITSIEKATQVAGEIGKYLKEEGFNMNFALNAVTKNANEKRAFKGEDAAIAKLAIAETNAYHENGIIPVFQTFPTNVLGIDKATSCVIMENVLNSKITGSEDVVCSMSAQAVEKLRKELGFSGIVISGPLNDEQITKKYDAKASAVAAIMAGNDLLYLPSDFKTAYQGVLEAVKSGSISIEQINNSVGRILTKKYENN